jgi:hypothetical protein
MMKTTFEPISQNFGDSFVDDVEKADGPKMIDKAHLRRQHRNCGKLENRKIKTKQNKLEKKKIKQN